MASAATAASASSRNLVTLGATAPPGRTMPVPNCFANLTMVRDRPRNCEGCVVESAVGWAGPHLLLQLGQSFYASALIYTSMRQHALQQELD